MRTPGRTPALNAWNFPPPIALARASAITPRAVFRCDRNRIRNGCASISNSGRRQRTWRLECHAADVAAGVRRGARDLSVAQHSPCLDEGHYLVEALPGLEVREHERTIAAHLARVAIHDLERRTDMRREVDLVDDEEIALHDAGAALARDLVPGRDVDDVQREIGELGAE